MEQALSVLAVAASFLCVALAILALSYARKISRKDPDQRDS